MVAIIYLQDVRYCPYLGRYTEPLTRNGEPFDVIWWERWDTPPNTALPSAVMGARQKYVFRRPSEMARSPVSKVASFAAFSRYVRGILRKNSYDKLVILTTMTGILLWDVLTGRYRGRYIYDVRDYSYERLAPYRALEGRVVDASAFTCVSSGGFYEFLPASGKYVQTDNFVQSDITAAQGMEFRKKPRGAQLVLSYMGFVRYFDENRRIIDRLVDDERFILEYHGDGADYARLREYAEERGCDRLRVSGYFDYAQDKPGLCARADIINNFYPRTLEIQRLATTNKTYDGMIYRRPQLVSAGTYSQRLVEEWGIGCALDIEQTDFADRLYEYYMGIDEAEFNKSAADALEVVRRRDAIYRSRIEQFLLSGR